MPLGVSTAFDVTHMHPELPCRLACIFRGKLVTESGPMSWVENLLSEPMMHVNIAAVWLSRWWCHFRSSFVFPQMVRPTGCDGIIKHNIQFQSEIWMAVDSFSLMSFSWSHQVVPNIVLLQGVFSWLCNSLSLILLPLYDLNRPEEPVFTFSSQSFAVRNTLTSLKEAGEDVFLMLCFVVMSDTLAGPARETKKLKGTVIEDGHLGQWFSRWREVQDLKVLTQGSPKPAQNETSLWLL